MDENLNRGLFNFRGHHAITALTWISLLAILAGSVVLGNTTVMPWDARFWFFVWLGVAILFTLLSHKEFVIGYLAGLFSMLIAWRIAAIYEINLITYPLLITFLLFFINFICCAWKNLQIPHRYLHAVSLAGWQLIFIRLYLGFNFIPHFTEKLFAGAGPHQKTVSAFVNLGVPNPNFFVWLAGLCEFGAAIALGLGLIMRLGTLGGVLYLAVATYLGHHFGLGFIWANPGGGWEFSALWMALMMSFVVTGIHAFSIDQRLEDKFKLPNWLKRIL